MAGISRKYRMLRRSQAMWVSRRVWQPRMVFWAGAISIGLISVLFAIMADQAQALRGGADRRPVTDGRPDEAAVSLGAEPVAVAADGQHVAVVQEPVEDRGRDHRICEHGAPFGNAAVRRDQHGAGFIAPADQLEEQVRRVGLQRQVAELVDDQQLLVSTAPAVSRPGAARRAPWRGQRPASSPS